MGHHFEVDFDFALGVGGVGLKAGPWVFGWVGRQASGYRVAVYVAEFFEALFRRKDVEVVIAGEPEGRFGELFGDRTF